MSKATRKQVIDYLKENFGTCKTYCSECAGCWATQLVGVLESLEEDVSPEFIKEMEKEAKTKKRIPLKDVMDDDYIQHLKEEAKENRLIEKHL